MKTQDKHSSSNVLDFVAYRRGLLAESSNIMKDIEEIQFADNVSPIRKLAPGDVLDVIRRLRGLMTTLETCAYTLYAGFDELGGGSALEKEAEKTRHTLELATARLASLLTNIEKTPAYLELRKETIARRKDRFGLTKEEK